MPGRRKLALKYRAVIIILITLIPFAAFFVSYSKKTLNSIDDQIAQGYANSLNVFIKGAQSAFSNADIFLFRDGWDNRILDLTTESSFTDVEKAADHIEELAKTLLSNNPEITGTLLIHPSTKYFKLTLQKGLNYNDTDQESIIKYYNDKDFLDSNANLGWILNDKTSHPYLMRIAYNNGFYIVAFVDLDKLSINAQLLYGLSSAVVFSKDNQVITNAYWSRTNIHSLPDLNIKNTYTLYEGKNQTYMVLSQTFLTMQATYAVSYTPNTGWVLLSSIMFLSASLLAFVIIWFFLKKALFAPLGSLVEVMNTIRSGDLSMRATHHSNSEEFAYIGNTFNQMLDTMSSLKIEAYERKLFADKAEMDALRLQIRPHFFLNCLKAIYGLAHSGQPQEIKSMVLLLSSHLRYTLNTHQTSTALSNEIATCKNYIELQGIGQLHKPTYTVNIDPALEDLPVPPVSILSLIENSVKYGTPQNTPLKVSITAANLQIDGQRLAQLIIRDNGPGFPEELLEKLNNRIDYLAQIGHFGVINVVRRFQLMYGNDFSILFSNNEGSQVELIILVNNAKEGGQSA